jgi:hypothetical protein
MGFSSYQKRRKRLLRYLSDPELTDLLRVLDGEEFPFQPVMRLLVYTGLRWMRSPRHAGGAGDGSSGNTPRTVTRIP